MDPGEQVTGTRDEQYNLISVLYHALQGAENSEKYALDAEAAGDDELAAFFRNIQSTNRQMAEQAKERLGIASVPSPGSAEVGSEIPPEGMVERERRSRTAAPPHGAIGPAEAGPEFSSAAPPPGEERREQRRTP